MSKQPKAKNNIITPICNNHIMHRTTAARLIAQYKEGLIKIPDLQRPLDNMKCTEIANKIIANNNWLLRLSNFELVRLGNLNHLYIIDGQHRFNSLLILDEQALPMDEIEVYIKITNVENKTEMQELFIDLNQNSNINPIYLEFNNDFYKLDVINIHNYIKQFKHAFSTRDKTNRGKNNHVLHINEFIELITIDTLEQFFNNTDNPDNTPIYELFINHINELNVKIKNWYDSFADVKDRSRYITPTNYTKSCETTWFINYDNINILQLLTNSADKLQISVINKK